MLLHAAMGKHVAGQISGKTVAIIGGAIIAIGAVKLAIGYSLPNFGVVGMGWLAILAGAYVGIRGFMRHMSSALKPDAEAHGEEGHAEIRLLVQAMAAMAMADRTIADEEVAEFAAVHREMLGLSIAPEHVRAMLADIDDQPDIAATLAAARADLPPVMREAILKACHRVMVSDRITDRAEEDKLAEIGAALGFRPEQIDRLTKQSAGATGDG